MNADSTCRDVERNAVKRIIRLLAVEFFGILDEGRLLFKTDAASATDYTARGMGAFTYESKGKVLTMAYHEVPPDVLEQPQKLVEWARKGHSTRGQCQETEAAEKIIAADKFNAAQSG